MTIWLSQRLLAHACAYAICDGDRTSDESHAVSDESHVKQWATAVQCTLCLMGAIRGPMAVASHLMPHATSKADPQCYPEQKLPELTPLSQCKLDWQ